MDKYVNDLQIQKDIFSHKLRTLMIKKGLTYKNEKPDPIALYNTLYPNDKLIVIDKDGHGFNRSEYSKIIRKYDNWIQGKSCPKNISDILFLCNALECDFDYLFTDMNCQTHDEQFIHTYTGLSEKVIKDMHILKNVDGIIDTLNDMFKYNLFNIVIDLKEGRKNLKTYLNRKSESLKKSKTSRNNQETIEDREELLRAAEKMGNSLSATKLNILNAQNNFYNIIKKLIPLED